MRESGETAAVSLEERIHYRDTLGDLFQRHKSAVIFGAGEMARRLLAVASPSQKARIPFLVGEGQATSAIGGIPVVSPQAGPPRPGALIVCADSHEREAAARARAWAGEVAEVIPLVSRSMLLYGRADPATASWPGKMYMLCTMERSGSTLLSALLTGTGIMGVPREHFGGYLRQHVQAGRIEYGEIAPEIFKGHQTPNGVFGAKIHAYQHPMFEEAVHALRGEDRRAIDSLVKSASYVQLVRRGVIRQAVSLWRARATGHYHAYRYRRPLITSLAGDLATLNFPGAMNTLRRRFQPKRPARPPYGYDTLRAALSDVLEERKYWAGHFARHGIVPLLLTYEEMIADFPGAVSRIVRHVGVPELPPASRHAPVSEKMADGYTEEIVVRFEEELDRRDPELLRDARQAGSTCAGGGE